MQKNNKLKALNNLGRLITASWSATKDKDDFGFVVEPEVRASANESGYAILHVRTGKIHLCNGVAACVWRGLKENRSRSEVAARIVREHSIAESEADLVLDKLLGDLERRELIVRRRRKHANASPVQLIARAMLELAYYDFTIRLRGYRAIRSALENCKANPLHRPAGDERLTREVVHAVSVASTMYGMPVKCLQRSVVLARLLRKFGVPAQVVIGYRTVPFISHAWAEVDGRVVNDSTAFPERMLILDRI